MNPADRLELPPLPSQHPDPARSKPLRAFLCRAITLVLFFLGFATHAQTATTPNSTTNGNALTYLDSADPFYPDARFPKLITPQWVGEPGVDAVVILAVDDMTESGKYETFLRPVLDRLKKIDGRAPISIMTRSVPVADPQVQSWLKEGFRSRFTRFNIPALFLRMEISKQQQQTSSDASIRSAKSRETSLWHSACPAAIRWIARVPVSTPNSSIDAALMAISFPSIPPS